jgi:alpha-mannosidase
MQAALFEVDERQLILSAVKKAQSRDTLVLRISNPTPRDVSTTLRALLPFTTAYLLNLDEQRQETLPVNGQQEAVLNIPAKTILTLELENCGGRQ